MTTSVMSQPNDMELEPLKAMTLLESIFMFGIPALMLAASLWWLRPALIKAGVTGASAYAFSLTIVNLGLLAAALIGYRLEGNPLTWPAFSKRMRLTAMTGKIWLWTLASTLLFGVLALLINPLAAFIYDALGFQMPDLTAGVMTVWMHLVVLFFNIVGEELWWRGYILPLQELNHGKHTWLIHGTLWACFHIFKWWAVPFMLVTCQIIPYVAQRTKNTWPGIINHLVINGAGMLMAAL